MLIYFLMRRKRKLVWLKVFSSRKKQIANFSENFPHFSKKSKQIILKFFFYWFSIVNKSISTFFINFEKKKFENNFSISKSEIRKVFCPPEIITRISFLPSSLLFSQFSDRKIFIQKILFEQLGNYRLKGKLFLSNDNYFFGLFWVSAAHFENVSGIYFENWMLFNICFAILVVFFILMNLWGILSSFVKFRPLKYFDSIWEYFDLGILLQQTVLREKNRRKKCLLWFMHITKTHHIWIVFFKSKKK